MKCQEAEAEKLQKIAANWNDPFNPIPEVAIDVFEYDEATKSFKCKGLTTEIRFGPYLEKYIVISHDEPQT